jgi:hypothetical protein
LGKLDYQVQLDSKEILVLKDLQVFRVPRVPLETLVLLEVPKV